MLGFGFFAAAAFHVPTFVALACAAALIYMLGKLVNRNSNANSPSS